MPVAEGYRLDASAFATGSTTGTHGRPVRKEEERGTRLERRQRTAVSWKQTGLKTRPLPPILLVLNQWLTGGLVIKRIKLETCHDIKADSAMGVDLTWIVVAPCTNTDSISTALEVSKEANSTNLVNINELCMVTPAKRLTKGNVVSDDSDDMATEDLVELAEVNTKLTLGLPENNASTL
ncbi:hypothetical protein E2562_038072 [Oryza meyeriana var. granulata]|uniref:Uncharacterized protein n=1 Tax=Oryza meyeriana var. granulata TaxID=110450 RepID=A0A6G1EU68_9ORYZ|nr:hypothetical protein E2562_038072 [Oryza meyeriana var. granulata]